MVPKDPSLQQPETGPGSVVSCPRLLLRLHHAVQRHTLSWAAVPTGLAQLALRRARRPRRLPQQACEGLWVSLSTAPPSDTLNHSQEERGSGGGDEVSLGVRK